MGFPSPGPHPRVGDEARWTLGSALLPDRMPGRLGPEQSTQDPGQQLTGLASASESPRGRVSKRQLGQPSFRTPALCHPTPPPPPPVFTHLPCTTFSLRVPATTQITASSKSCPPAQASFLQLVPGCALPAVPTVHGHLKLSWSETTHFLALKAAFLSHVSSHSWGHHHPSQPQDARLDLSHSSLTPAPCSLHWL